MTYHLSYMLALSFIISIENSSMKKWLLAQIGIFNLKLSTTSDRNEAEVKS